MPTLKSPPSREGIPGCLDGQLHLCVATARTIPEKRTIDRRSVGKGSIGCNLFAAEVMARVDHDTRDLDSVRYRQEDADRAVFTRSLLPGSPSSIHSDADELPQRISAGPTTNPSRRVTGAFSAGTV